MIQIANRKVIYASILGIVITSVSLFALAIVVSNFAKTPLTTFVDDSVPIFGRTVERVGSQDSVSVSVTRYGWPVYVNGADITPLYYIWIGATAIIVPLAFFKTVRSGSGNAIKQGKKFDWI